MPKVQTFIDPTAENEQLIPKRLYLFGKCLRM